LANCFGTSSLRPPYPNPQQIWGEGPLVDLTMSVNTKVSGTRARGTRSAHGARPQESNARAIDLCRSAEGFTIARELGIGTKTFRKGMGVRTRAITM
jgi:hypothetical protein